MEVIPLGTLWRSYPMFEGGGGVDGFPLRIPEDRANALSFVVCICPKIGVLTNFSY